MSHCINTTSLLRLFAAFPLIVYSCLSPHNLCGQETTGAFRGQISDPSGGRIRNASVTATQLETGLTRKTTSDDGGEYTLALLPVGHYQIEVTAGGFDTYVRSGVTLAVDEMLMLDVSLVVGSQRESVNVTADATAVETTSDLGQTVQQKEILDLPLNGRNFTQLGLLQPGVAPVTIGLKD